MKGRGPKCFRLSYMSGGPSRGGLHRSGAASQVPVEGTDVGQKGVAEI